MGCGQKILSVSVAVPPAPFWVPCPQCSVSHVGLNDKADNETILGAVHRSPGICLTAEENPRKPQLGDRLICGLCDLKWDPFLPNGVGRIAQHVRKGEGRKQERAG